MSAPDGRRILAPGKLVLFGEYAVLEGHPAVVMAVDRLASIFRCERGEGSGDSLVAFARRQATRALRLDWPRDEYRADSSRFYHGERKLGLGSSAAVVSGAVASVFHDARLDIERFEVRERMWKIAREVHGCFQGANGSGIDLAASIFGGTLVMRRNGAKFHRFSHWDLPRGVRLVFLWSTKPASTPQFLDAFSLFKSRDAAACRSITLEMGGLVDHLTNTSYRTTAGDFLSAVDEYSGLMSEMGRKSGMPIVTDEMQRVFDLARSIGGAAKPSGAGGGDFVLAAFSEAGEEKDFLSYAERWGFVQFDLKLARRGVHAEYGG